MVRHKHCSGSVHEERENFRQGQKIEIYYTFFFENASPCAHSLQSFHGFPSEQRTNVGVG